MKYLIIILSLAFISCKGTAQVCLKVDCADSLQFPMVADTLNATFTGEEIGSSLWMFVKGPSVPYIMNPASLTTKVNNLTVPGIYVFEQTITTKNLNTYTAHDTITVLIPPKLGTLFVNNKIITIYQDGSVDSK